MNKMKRNNLSETIGHKTLFWTVNTMLAAVFMLHPEILHIAHAADFGGQTNIDLSDLSDVSGGDVQLYSGVALGNTTHLLYNSIVRVISPTAAIVAGAFGLFALVRGFNIAVIGSAFGVAVVAGILPRMLLGLFGHSTAGIF